ncbi:MAG TPA: hypothetical protein VFG58_10630 [Solirubrobacterales bacterium]|nr:hypothetical protein [Solirubrobacterales bacterium]
MTGPQTNTVELDAELAERARREAERRGITLKEFVDHALRRFLASEEQRATREAQRRRAAAEQARGMLADGSRRRATDELIAERRAEARAENREDDVL